MRSRKEPRIVDPLTHPKRTVCLRVAADYLGIDERTLRLFVDSGDLPAFRAGRIYRITLRDLIAFEERGRGPDPLPMPKVPRPTAVAASNSTSGSDNR